jgi:hypothetical protein
MGSRKFAGRAFYEAGAFGQGPNEKTNHTAIPMTAVATPSAKPSVNTSSEVLFLATLDILRH